MSHLQIAYFLAVVKFGGISEAARNLFVAQSAVSKQIQMLETKLDMKLFVRDGRNVVLTPAGEILYKNLSKYNDWLWQIINMAKAVDKGSAGVLHIGLQHGLNFSEEIVRLIQKFYEDNPGIEINIRRVTLVDMMQNLNVGTVDLVMTHSFMVTSAEREELSSYVLDEVRDEILVSKYHPLGQLKSFSVEDFLQHTFVAVSPEVSSGAFMNSMAYLRGLGIEPIKIMYVPSIEDIMLGIEYGLAYGIASRFSRLSKWDSIRFIDAYAEFSQPRNLTKIIAFWRKNTPNILTEQLIEFIKEHRHKQAQPKGRQK